MFQTVKRIFGVSESDLPGITAQQQQGHDNATASYLPEHKVPKNIEGTAGDGSYWTFWRNDPTTGVRWFRRVSG